MWITKQELEKKIRRCASKLSKIAKLKPKIAVQTGSGQHLEFLDYKKELELDYEQLVGFPTPRAEGHKGLLRLLSSDKGSFVHLDGRSHLYEGYEAWELGFPIRVLADLKIKDLVLLNAAGAVDESLCVGDIVLIKDFLDFSGQSALRGIEGQSGKVNFVSLSEFPDSRLVQLMLTAAQKSEIRISEGIYAMTLGPRYETNAEIRFLKSSGATVVGMSTVPEIVTGIALSMGTLAISVVTNVASSSELEHSSVLKVSAQQSDKLSMLLRNFLIEYLAQS